MSVRDEIRAKLSGEGGPFEIVDGDVLGERMPMLKNRIPSLRQVLANSEAQGDKEYLVHGERRITYAQHVRHVASVAQALRERYGIEKGDRVAILAANCPEWPISFWATVSLGAIVSSLNGWWTADEIAYGVAHSSPKLLIGDRKRLARADGLDLGVPVLEIESEFEALLEHAPDAPLPDVEIAEDDPAVILFTSGTTGRPKGAVNTHRGIVGFVQTNMLAGAELMMVEAASGGPPPAPPTTQAVVLATSPMFHLSGLYANIVMQLAVGGKLVTREGRFDPEDMLRIIEREGVTMWSALGGTGARIASHPSLAAYDLSTVTSVGFGGAPTSPAVQEMIREAFPNASDNLGIGYGSSETVAVPTSLRGREYKAHPESAGRVMPTHEVEIRDDAGEVLGEGEEGEIFVRSPYLMLEYWDDPGSTAKTLLPGRWLATGDVGRFEDGLLYINSRARDMILRNAENIYPVEIEYRLEAHPEVREAAVIGVDHPVMGQEVKAVVVVEPGRAPDEEALAAWCAESLAGFKVPTIWEIRDEALPRNPSGKVLKNVLSGETTNKFVED